MRVASTGASAIGPVEVADSDMIHLQIANHDPDDPTKLWLWVIADNMRAGSVQNAVRLAEIVFEL